MSVLLVTLAIGEKFIVEYNSLFRQSHEEYAKKCGYDFKVITEHLDHTYNTETISIYLQKVLICSQEWDYEYIVFIDADILIHRAAPPIHDFMDLGGKIGIVEEYSQPTKEMRLWIQRINGWETSAADYYKLAGFDLSTDMVFNSGVMVFQPKLHREFLENIYNTYIEQFIHHPRGAHFEQSCIGYELQTRNMYTLLPKKFNAIWSLQASSEGNMVSASDFFRSNYFMHFAGHFGYNDIPALYTF